MCSLPGADVFQIETCLERQRANEILGSSVVLLEGFFQPILDIPPGAPALRRHFAVHTVTPAKDVLAQLKAGSCRGW